jgi:hypothetical protein
MKMIRHGNRRRAAVLPLTAMCGTALFGFLALSIDIGMIAIARSQCQNAADSAALAGARTFNGNPTAGTVNGSSTGSYNFYLVPGNAVAAAVANKVLATTIPGNASTSWDFSNPATYSFSTGNVTIQVGSYAYVYNDSNPSSEGFQLSIPRSSTSNPWSAVNATVTYAGTNSFAQVFGITGFNTSATATAAHRPRDDVMIVDMSGSMRFQSLPGGDYYGQRTYSMNPDPNFPQFGHYSNVSAAALQNTSSVNNDPGYWLDPCNISIGNNSGPCIIADFLQSNGGSAAFTSTPSSESTTPGGDNFPYSNGSTSTYASNVQDMLNTTTYNSTWETSGYGANYNGFTEGPSYWGKTFFMWPPDPRGATQAPPSSTTTTTYAYWYNNGAMDWRQRFFVKVNTSNSNTPAWCDDNTILFDSNSHFNTPGTTVSIGGSNWTYYINYAAILYWLKNTGVSGRVNPFPGSLWCGYISYYTSIPDPTDATLNNRFWTSSSLSNLDEQFWKDYIDFVLGLQGTGANTYNQVIGMIGNGDVYSWGNYAGQITSKQVQSGKVNNSSGYSTGATSIALKNLSQAPVANQKIQFGSSSTQYTIISVSGYSFSHGSGSGTITLSSGLTSNVSSSASVYIFRQEYMNYQDNPYRPRHQYWFGPMTMVDYLGNYNTGQMWWPGNVHEAQGWACKVGVQTAIQDIQNNHPNDFITLIYFSTPMYSNSDTTGVWNMAIVPMGQQYTTMTSALWFPQAVVNGSLTQVNCYDSTNMNWVPRAHGGTTPQMGFMLAYNQLSSDVNDLRLYSTPTSTYRGSAGGLGRNGANRLIVFETDGEPNTGATATLAGSGSNSYYPIRVKNPANPYSSSNVEWPSSPWYGYSSSDVNAVVTQICALNTASPPGFSTATKPMQIHCIGFGFLFDPANAGTDQTAALNFLQSIEYIGNVLPSASTALESYKQIYGTYSQRISSMQTAYKTIMQSGVQVSLLK